MNNDLIQSVSTLWFQVINGIILGLPRFFFGLLVFALGLVVGAFVKKLVVKTLKAVKFEHIFTDGKIRTFLQKAEITEKIEVVIGSLLKWLVIITFFVAATNIWGLTTVSTLLIGIISYIPNVLSAIIVLSIGILLAGLVEGMIKAGMTSFDLRTARLMGKIGSYLVVTIAALAALSELHIAKDFVNIIFIGFISMLALGFGAKDIVGKILADWYKSQKTKN
jgi:hypothetical protein